MGRNDAWVNCKITIQRITNRKDKDEHNLNKCEQLCEWIHTSSILL